MCVCVLCRPGRDGAGAGGGNKVGAGGGEGGMARGRGEMGGAPSPAIRMADIREVTDRICKHRKSYKRK